MVRKLKHHEQKLLKKVDFLDKDRRTIEVMHRYHIQRREDYTKYNKLCGQIKRLALKVSELDMKDGHRLKVTNQLLERLFGMGVIPSTKSLQLCDKVTVSAFCRIRRRLPVVMVRMKMSESVKQAVKLVEQGHVRVGPNAVSDPAFLVTRKMEDFVTWVDSSKIKHHIMKYNDKLDDFDLL